MSTQDFSVLHGFRASAGQPAAMAQSLRRAGVEASSVLVGPNKFGYPCDYHFPDTSPQTMRAVLSELAAKRDIVHIHAITPFFQRGRVRFPMGADLVALKAAGVRIVMHFRGTEVRMASLFRQHSPFHYVDDDSDGLMAKFPEEWQRDYIALCGTLADQLVVTDPELLTYVPNAKIIQRAIDMDHWGYVGLANNTRPVVVHAPSRAGVKGTHHVLDAVHALQKEGLNFEFKLVQGLSNTEARVLYEQADIVIDQLRIGWYGVLAVEAMALGKAVVSYIRSDLLPHFNEAPPVAVADPHSLKDVLRELVLSPERRRVVAQQGHEFCRSTHDAAKVAETSIALYQDIVNRPRLDPAPYLAFTARQEDLMNAALLEAKKLGAKSKAVPAYPHSLIKRAYNRFRRIHGIVSRLTTRARKPTRQR